jgi:hypothetical protein
MFIATVTKTFLLAWYVAVTFTIGSVNAGPQGLLQVLLHPLFIGDGCCFVLFIVFGFYVGESETKLGRVCITDGNGDENLMVSHGLYIRIIISCNLS